MSFAELCTDIISILKQNGERYDDIKSIVQNNGIFVEGTKPLIESGDLAYRKMSNGAEETYQIIDPGFHEAFHGISAGYQMKVKKLGIPEARKAKEEIHNHITYNINGHNARVNQNSVDNSTNIINNANALALLTELRSKIEGLDISLAEKQSANEHLDVIDSQITSEKPSKSVVSAMINHLPDAVKAIDSVNELVNCLQTSGIF